MIERISSNCEVRFCDNLCDQQGLYSIDGKASLVFTSPPYWDYMDYGRDDEVGKEGSYQGYIYSLGETFKGCEHALSPGGKLIVNITNMKSRKDQRKPGDLVSLWTLVPDTIAMAQKAGFTFFDEIIWVKGGRGKTTNGKPLFGSYPFPPTPKIMDNIWENILVFVKPGKRVMPSMAEKEKSRLTQDEWKEMTNGIWNIHSGSHPDHPATFPIALAERIVRLYSFVDDLVIDPWAGTGTLVEACSKWDRRAIGYELNPDFAPAVRKRKAPAAP